MKVSIIVPVYNVEKYIDQTINSIINQDYKNIEPIFVDDGSTDNSLKILTEYEKKGKIKLIKQKNSGAPAARNKGLAAASGDYVMFFDSDDILEKNAISELIKNSNNADLVQGNFEIVDDNIKHIEYKNITETNKVIKENIMKECFILPPFPCNKIYKRETILKNNIIFDNVKIAQDLNFYMKFLSISKEVVIINSNILKYRKSPNSISRTYTYKIFDIVNSFKYIEDFYIKNGYENYINTYLSILKLNHYNNQMGKMYYFKAKKERKEVFNYFYKEIKKIKFKNIDSKYKKKLRKIKMKKVLIALFISNYYSNKIINKNLI